MNDPESSRLSENRLTHLDERGRARMVDIGDKVPALREAVARGRVLMARETLELIRGGLVKKGDVLAVARVAGIMAAKRTGELIPLCHPLGLEVAEVGFDLSEDPPAVEITARAALTGKTGVEMEALTAVSVAALTIYDMCKAADKKMVIDAIRLVKKTGGRSGTFLAE